MQKKHLKYTVIVLLSLVSLLYGLIVRQGQGSEKKVGQPAADLFRVSHIFDGDTVSVIINSREERIRLIGIDAPEMGQRPWGKRSREHLQEILNATSQTVKLEYDLVRRDKYGRLLGYLRTRDGKLVNEMMVRDGYAVLFTFPPNVKYVDLFTKAEKEAREKRLGLWGRDGLRQAPSDYRKQHPRH